MKDFPMITAAALLYWGYNTGNLLTAAAFAAVSEAARFMPFRFGLKDKDFSNISVITTLSLAGYLIYFVNSGQRTGAIYGLLSFLPVSLFPLHFFFIYSDSVSVNASRFFLLFVVNKYSMVSRFIRHFRPDSLFLASLVLAGSVTMKNGTGYFLFIICGAVIIKYSGIRFNKLIFPLILTGILAFVIRAGLFGSLSYIRDYLTELYLERRTNFRHGTSDIGSIAGSKNRYRIEIRAESGGPRKIYFRLRDRSFNTYSNGVWSESAKENIPFNTGLMSFNEQDSDSVRIYFFSGSRRSRIVMPFGTYDLSGLETGKLDLNDLGNLTTGYTQHLVDYKAFRGGNSFDHLMPAASENDLVFTDSDSVYTDAVIRHLGLKGLGPAEIYGALLNYFISSYAYSLDYADLPGRLKLDHFLKEKKGHCELFATLTALIYRRLGYHSRYVTGYLITEFSDIEKVYYGRSKDRHAWVQVWTEKGGWSEFDTTPPDISGTYESRNPLGKVYDLLSYAYFSFFKFKKENSDLYQSILLYSLIPLGLFLFLRILKDVRLSKDKRGGAISNYSVSEELRIIENSLKGHGTDPGNRTVGEWFFELGEKFPALTHPLDAVKRIYYGKRYGGKEPDAGQKQDFDRHTDEFRSGR